MAVMDKLTTLEEVITDLRVDVHSVHGRMEAVVAMVTDLRNQVGDPELEMRLDEIIAAAQDSDVAAESAIAQADTVLTPAEPEPEPEPQPEEGQGE